MLLNLSKRFVDKSELMTLGIKGFGMDDYQVGACMDENRNSTTDAAHQLLREWRENYDDAQVAYQELCKVLDNIDMRYYKNLLK